MSYRADHEEKRGGGQALVGILRHIKCLILGLTDCHSKREFCRKPCHALFEQYCRI